MKLGYRDRVILIVAIVAVIFIIAIFAFIKPKYEELNNNKTTYQTLSDEWDAKLIEFDRIPSKQNTIKNRYDESLKVADEFTDEMTSIELEEFLKTNFLNTEKFQTDEVVLKNSMAVSDEQTAPVNYYFYVPNMVTYPLYENADLDGSLAVEAAERLMESNILSARSAQTIGVGNSTFTLQINKEDTLDLLDAVKAYAEQHKDAMMISNVVIKEYDFNENVEGAQQAAPQLDEEGNPIAPAAVATTEEGVKPGYTEVTITYRSLYIQEPTEPDVGPEYDKSIWDTEEWRDPVTAE
jgi:hypothetical protein